MLTTFEYSLQVFHRSLQYKISRKSVQLEPSSCMRRDRQTDGQTDRRDETIGALAAYAKATSYRSRFLRLDKKKSNRLQQHGYTFIINWKKRTQALSKPDDMFYEKMAS